MLFLISSKNFWGIKGFGTLKDHRRHEKIGKALF